MVSGRAGWPGRAGWRKGASVRRRPRRVRRARRATCARGGGAEPTADIRRPVAGSTVCDYLVEVDAEATACEALHQTTGVWWALAVRAVHRHRAGPIPAGLISPCRASSPYAARRRRRAEMLAAVEGLMKRLAPMNAEDPLLPGALLATPSRSRGCVHRVAGVRPRRPRGGQRSRSRDGDRAPHAPSGQSRMRENRTSGSTSGDWKLRGVRRLRAKAAGNSCLPPARRRLYEPRVAPRLARRLAGKARRGSKLGICDRGAKRIGRLPRRSASFYAVRRDATSIRRCPRGSAGFGANRMQRGFYHGLLGGAGAPARHTV